MSASIGRLKFGSTASLASIDGNDSHAVEASGTMNGLNDALQSLYYQPDADAFGADTVTLAVYNNATGATGVPGVFPVLVQTVNDPPSFGIGGDLTTPDNAGRQTVPGFVTGMSAGPGESQQPDLAGHQRD